MYVDIVISNIFYLNKHFFFFFFSFCHTPALLRLTATMRSAAMLVTATMRRAVMLMTAAMRRDVMLVTATMRRAAMLVTATMWRAAMLVTATMRRTEMLVTAMFVWCYVVLKCYIVRNPLQTYAFWNLCIFLCTDQNVTTVCRVILY